MRAGYGLIFFEQSGITTPFTIPQFPFIQTVGQQSQDNLNAAFALSSGPAVRSALRMQTRVWDKVSSASITIMVPATRSSAT